ncbi:hypothetical protein [Nitrosomonas ureae]|uniref:Uncharacterized protein n=1 Tax=Nitrosomonas ureae TaxID=44577 RepID=A0A1H9D1R7_9PROT|nr:hypothetical protein [Nitrosomonas ureae]SEQ07307.1 hypothetical protein SAMN05421510_101844 [Nitrosomonas ureae]
MTTSLKMTKPVERRAIVTPFGIRFWDPALDSQVHDGLTVTAIPLEGGGKARLGLRTASGIYAFHGLPGFHDLEYPVDAANLNSSPPYMRRFIVRVVDNWNRFLSIAFSVNLPFPSIYPTNSSNKLPGFYLFSAPTRPNIPTLAIVRARLIEKPSSTTVVKPAANAVLEIQESNNRMWYGIADENGSVTVLFPYPTFTGASSIRLSPPAEKWHQHWGITIRIRYAPARLDMFPGSPIPELRSILNQPQAVLWPNSTAFAENLSTTLTFGEELILRTDMQSVLWIQPS